MPDQVECYSGLEYAERPTAVWWEGARLEVETVEAEWRTPEGKGFRVRTADGRKFELTFASHPGEWSVRPK
jgi:hypothetical protein